MNLILFTVYSLSLGLINGLLGSGGGIVAILLLERLGYSGKYAHSTSLGIMLPLSLLSLLVYYLHADLPIIQAIPYLLFGFVGSFIGAHFLRKIDSFYLKKIFAIFMLYMAVRMLFV